MLFYHIINDWSYFSAIIYTFEPRIIDSTRLKFRERAAQVSTSERLTADSARLNCSAYFIL